jgi:LacI family transcriptional regulator
MARAVEDAARERGYSLIFGNTDEDPGKEAEYLEVLLEKQVDGLIVSPARATSPQLEGLVRDGVPVVFLDRYVRDIEAPVVRSDGRRAVDELVEHMMSFGHEKLAIISGPSETVPGRERLEAFLNFRRESGFETMRELLNLEEPPTAVFAANNLMALGALQALKRAGVRVPEDMSFASFDDVSWFELVEPSITAIAQPVSELGIAAAEMLPALVGGEEAESVILDAELVVRGSCGEIGGRV